ncbi:hypothetical protein GLOIN_2v1880888 [Rhizophagus irregularis DAOM 181602=DAOM 197198]|nr:hypothetical protein GLOIN_2v1880888 [Rhizophagus irregularis DAOM 181602=DAOM 197198]
MESGNKLRESSRKKIEELLIEGNHKRSDRGRSRSRSNSSKTNINTNETINDEFMLLRLRDGFLFIIYLHSNYFEFRLILGCCENVSKLLIKVSIYPTKDECCGAVEGYLSLNHASFFSNFTEDDWISFYNENIHKQPVYKDESQGQKFFDCFKKINNQTGINYSDFEDNSYEEEESGNETEDDEDDDVMMYNKDW